MTTLAPYFILAFDKDMHESLNEFKFQPDTTTDSGVICPWASEKLMYDVVKTLAPSFLIGSFSFLQVTWTTIKSRMSSKFGQIRPCTAELAALDGLKIISINYKWEKCCDYSSAFIFDWNRFILAGNKDMHKSLNEFEFQPDPTTDYGVT